MSRMVGAVALVGVAALAVAGVWLSFGDGGADRVSKDFPNIPVAVTFTPHYGHAGADRNYESIGGIGTWGWNIMSRGDLNRSQGEIRSVMR